MVLSGKTVGTLDKNKNTAIQVINALLKNKKQEPIWGDEFIAAACWSVHKKEKKKIGGGDDRKDILPEN